MMKAVSLICACSGVKDGPADKEAETQSEEEEEEEEEVEAMIWS